MNPWGAILVAVGILLIMIGITGSQHKILQVFKGIPAAAGGTSVNTATNPNTGPINTTSTNQAPVQLA
jgi:hypothetical protein